MRIPSAKKVMRPTWSTVAVSKTFPPFGVRETPPAIASETFVTLGVSGLDISEIKEESILELELAARYQTAELLEVLGISPKGICSPKALSLVWLISVVVVGLPVGTPVNLPEGIIVLAPTIGEVKYAVSFTPVQVTLTVF